TSRQASLARDDVAAQVDLAHPSAGQSRESSSDSTTTSLFPPLGELSDADGPVQTSAHENHIEDDPAGKPPSASARPESCSPVTVAAPAESYPAPLFAMQPAVTAPSEPLETPSPSAEPYQTASIACPASTSPITQPVGAAVASSRTPTPNPSNVEVFSSIEECLYPHLMPVRTLVSTRLPTMSFVTMLADRIPADAQFMKLIFVTEVCSLRLTETLERLLERRRKYNSSRLDYPVLCKARKYRSASTRRCLMSLSKMIPKLPH
ncbi:hypothetical protein LTR53_015425, partial [Teratosphaeriaceae sp. CCFEE 6253]